MCANQGPRIPGLICKRTRRCCRRTRRRWTCTRRIARTCGCIWWRGRRWIPTDWTQQRQESFRICRQASRISNLQGWNRRKIYSAQATLCTRRRKPGKLKFTSMYSLLLLLQLEGNLLTERERERGLPIQIRRRQKCKARRMGSFWSTIRGISSSAILDRALLPLSLFSRVYRISSIENKVNRVLRKVPNSRLVSYSPLIPRRWSPLLLVSRTKTRPERRWGTIVWNRRRWGRSRTPWAWRKGIFGTSRIRLV